MAMEAEVMTEQVEGAHDVDRRARTERRRRDRRKPGNRINRDAPAHSLIKVFGAFGVAIMSAVVTLTACNTVKGLGRDIESVGEAGDRAT